MTDKTIRDVAKTQQQQQAGEAFNKPSQSGANERSNQPRPQEPIGTASHEPSSGRGNFRGRGVGNARGYGNFQSSGGAQQPLAQAEQPLTIDAPVPTTAPPAQILPSPIIPSNALTTAPPASATPVSTALVTTSALPARPEGAVSRSLRDDLTRFANEPHRRDRPMLQVAIDYRDRLWEEEENRDVNDEGEPPMEYYIFLDAYIAHLEQGGEP